MSITKSIGKNTLGGGKKMNVNLRTYNRSTHDLSYAWRSSMTVGTLTPFMKIVGLPGDTFDIALDTKVFTHPTIGPLFGSYKMQMDIFTVPFRLYMAPLHNNALNVGMNMSQIKIPMIQPTIPVPADNPTASNDNPWQQINPSSILRYLGMETMDETVNAIPLLGYLDIFKNYYANKQEEKFYGLLGDEANITTAATIGLIYDDNRYYPSITAGTITVPTNKVTENMYLRTATAEGITLYTYSMTDGKYFETSTAGSDTIYTVIENLNGSERMRGTANAVISGTPLKIKDYELSTLDDLREYLLSQGMNQVTLTTSNNGGVQYITDVLGRNTTINRFNVSQPLAGLLLKTYQSDIFSNWIQTDWIDGENGISSITAVDTSSGEFTIDTLNLAKKVYDMLNRIAVSGGTYHDWIETVYTAGSVPHAETPIYEGGMSTEIEFEQVVSNSATENEPLGTLAGRGRDNGKKGGRLHIKVTEPCYIMGIVSITPRVDYAHGIDWDIEQLKTMDDLHKPALDAIGFQDLKMQQITQWAANSTAIGKQPAWINYMTNYNKVFGNFAIKDNEMFMCLVHDIDLNYNSNGAITTEINWSSYIDPQLYNYIFADTSLDAQNFWVQIGCGVKARRVMSAKQIPNL